MARCCPCPCVSTAEGAKPGLPLICLVPRDEARAVPHGHRPGPRPSRAPGSVSSDGFQLLDEAYIKKHFKLPPRPLYLDPFRRPLITFPLAQETTNNFSMDKKYKINQQILDGFLDPSAAITANSVFPYGKSDAQKRKESEEDDEIIYILQLPDYEFKCPVHNHTIRTPRFIWHSCKKTGKKDGKDEAKQGGGPLKRPKPWLLSRHTDFDLMSQW